MFQHLEGNSDFYKGAFPIIPFGEVTDMKYRYARAFGSHPLALTGEESWFELLIYYEKFLDEQKENENGGNNELMNIITNGTL